MSRHCFPALLKCVPGHRWNNNLLKFCTERYLGIRAVLSGDVDIVLVSILSYDDFFSFLFSHAVSLPNGTDPFPSDDAACFLDAEL